MRTAIYENCLEENTEQLMSFRQYQLDNRLNDQAAMFGSNQEVMDLLQDD